MKPGKSFELNRYYMLYGTNMEKILSIGPASNYRSVNVYARKTAKTHDLRLAIRNSEFARFSDR